MEVHAHTHTPRKKWTHYFWEFLMLFLAVFCGFLAEYQLEHKIEKNREKEMIVSLIEDLKSDTSILGRRILNKKVYKNIMDSLVILLTAPDIKEKGSDIYYFGRLIFRFTYPKYADRTIQQLKNAGSFRLIKNNQVANNILKYYSRWDGLVSLQNLGEERGQEFMVSTRQFFNPLVFEEMVNDETENRVIKPEGNPSLLTYNKEQIFTVISIIHNLKSTNRALQMGYVEIKNEATELIGFLEDKYHLK
jgi:hypothetical protein